LDYVKNVRLNDKDYYQELKMAIFYITSSLIHFFICGIILPAILNISVSE